MVLQGLDRRQLVVAAAAAFTEQLLGIAEAAGSDLAHVSLREAGFAPDLEARHRLFCLHDPNAPALAEGATGTGVPLVTVGRDCSFFRASISFWP